MGGNHNVKADRGSNLNAFIDVDLDLLQHVEVVVVVGSHGSDEHTLKGAVRQPAAASPCRFNLAPHHLSLL